MQIGTKYSIVVRLGYFKVSDGIHEWIASDQQDATSSSQPIYLFNAPNVSSNASCKICSFKVRQNRKTILCLAPVKNNSIGYFYDRVSCRLFNKSGGEGDFVVGPNKAKPLIGLHVCRNGGI